MIEFVGYIMRFFPHTYGACYFSCSYEVLIGHTCFIAVTLCLSYPHHCSKQYEHWQHVNHPREIVKLGGRKQKLVSVLQQRKSHDRHWLTFGMVKLPGMRSLSLFSERYRE
jgi:hypothetical protein